MQYVKVVEQDWLVTQTQSFGKLVIRDGAAITAPPGKCVPAIIQGGTVTNEVADGISISNSEESFTASWSLGTANIWCAMPAWSWMALAPTTSWERAPG